MTADERLRKLFVGKKAYKVGRFRLTLSNRR